jgi:hypothetical protein
MNIEFTGLTFDFATKTLTGFLNAPSFTLAGLKKISNKNSNEPIFIADYKDLSTATYVSGTGVLTLSALPSNYSASNNTDVFVATYGDLNSVVESAFQTGPTISYSVSAVANTANYLVPFGTNTIMMRVRNGATGLNITPQYSTDASPSTWNSLVQRRRDTISAAVAGATGAITNQAIYELDVAGLQGMNVRLNITALTSGSCTVDFTPLSSLPTQVGVNAIPTVSLASTTVVRLNLTSGDGITPARLMIGSGTGFVAATGVLKASTNALLASMSYENREATARWVHLYNQTTAPTLGTSTPLHSYYCKPNDITPFVLPTIGLRFATGLAFAVTTDNIPVPAGTLTLLTTPGNGCLIHTTL